MDNNPKLKGILLTGEGPYYSAGNDIMVFAEQVKNGGDVREFMQQARDMCRDFVQSFITYNKLLVVAVNGPCIGIACTTLPLCDLVYCSDSAWFQTPFMHLGLCPEGCSSYTFPRLMGRTNANEFLLLGKKFDAKRVQELGLVSDVYKHSEFEANVLKQVEILSKYPPQALVQAKGLVANNEFRKTLIETNERECDVLKGRWESKEAQNAMIQFMIRGNANGKSKI